ncbi:MAG TPA: TerC family protein [Pirellulaceae bacterium]
MQLDWGDWIIGLVALTAMEIVLGIDNIVFIAISTNKLPPAQRPFARRVGLLLALVMRIGLVCAISWLMSLTQPIFHLTSLGIPESWFQHWEHSEEIIAVSWKDLILLGGGLFLIHKSVREIHEKVEHHDSHRAEKPRHSFAGVIGQILVMDLIFSLDSVITAVGMVKHVPVMITAIIVAVAVMLAFANPISEFVTRHPTLTMLALSFLILIGIMLVAEAIGTHIDKGYIYFAMAFSLAVEFLNLRLRPSKHPA